MYRLLTYARSLGTYLAAAMIPMLVNLLINPLIALNMTPEDYAITGFYTSFSTLIGPIITFYMLHYYMKRYYEIDDAQRVVLRATIYKALVLFSSIISIICFVLLLVYIYWQNSNLELTDVGYLVMAVVALPLTGLYNLELTEYKMQRKSSAYFYISLFAGVTLAIANLLFVVAIKWGAFGKLLAPLIANLIVFLCVFWKYRAYWSISTPSIEWQSMLKFCYPLTFGATLGYFFNGFDRTCLATIGNAHEYGYYVVGAQFASYLMLFAMAIDSTFRSDLYEAITKRERQRTVKIAMMQIGVILSVVVLFALFCPLIIRILTAGRYMASVPYARIISISVLTSSLYYIVNNYTIVRGYPKMYLYTSLIGAILTILGMRLFVNKYQFIGGGYMVSFSYVILLAVNVVLLGYKRIVYNCRIKVYE